MVSMTSFACSSVKWANKGHEINLGVRNIIDFKGKQLLNNPNTKVLTIDEAVKNSEVL